MQIIKVIVTVVFILVCAALTFLVLLQEGKQQGLGAIGGIADSYWGKNKGRSMEGVMVKITTWLAVAFMIIALLLNIPAIFG
ncbi:MAG: preprotein translocase subunit SecG [Lachnospiraceae bacterium]|jgi:preprotein translocase subunit SecG|nr:preprotein translocase subunit SecG [Lachnospiraceae bacterium]MBP5565257.1 preprotein translocase subunit SecG [Lachnospiraceae bacterium]MCR4697445.1 preprotein translocase subunit SecG [Lachnospiraceae bacterium]